MATLPTTAPPNSYTFRALQSQTLTWYLTDDSGAPITGATVVATLYSDRNRVDPTTQPGVAVTGFTNISLAETPALSGIYQGLISATFNPPATTYGFVLNVVATLSVVIGNWNALAVVLPAEVNNDLVLLDDVKSWLKISSVNNDDDGLLQMLISGFSAYVYNYTGRDNFTQVRNFVETYDGNGAQRMFLRNSPIRTLNSVLICSWSVPQSSSPTVPGLFIELSQKSIALRTSGWALMPPQAIYPYQFTRGLGNIIVDYNAGYTQVPFDLGEAAIKAIAINYRRREWADMASKSLSASPASATIRFRDWALPPEIVAVLDFYSRQAII